MNQPQIVSQGQQGNSRDNVTLLAQFADLTRVNAMRRDPDTMEELLPAHCKTKLGPFLKEISRNHRWTSFRAEGAILGARRTTMNNTVPLV